MENKPYGYTIFFRFRYGHKGPDDIDFTYDWTFWSEYWNHKIYKTEAIANEAIGYIRESSFKGSTVEFQIKPLFLLN